MASAINLSATLLIFSALLFYSPTFSHACGTCSSAPQPAPEFEPPTPSLSPLTPITPAPLAPSTPQPAPEFEPPTPSLTPLTPITPASCVTPSTPSPSPSPSPLTPAPSPALGTCPRDTLKLGVCVNLLGLVSIPIGATSPCCALFEGLVDLDVALCLCTALKANVIGVNLDVPIALSLILGACQKTIPPGFQCA